MTLKKLLTDLLLRVQLGKIAKTAFQGTHARSFVFE